VTNLLDMGFTAVLLPTWVHTHGYGAGVLGLIGSVYGLSGTVGSVIAALVGDRLPRRTTFIAGFLLCGAPRWVVLGLDAPVPAVLAVCLVGGLGAGVLNPILGAVYAQRIPRDLLGRVNSMSDAVAWAGMPLGSAAAGLAAVAVGLSPVLLVGGSVYLVVTLLPVRGAAWHELDRRPATGPRTAAAVPASPDGAAEPFGGPAVAMASDQDGM
jgi:MFS family permease